VIFRSKFVETAAFRPHEQLELFDPLLERSPRKTLSVGSAEESNREEQQAKRQPSLTRRRGCQAGDDRTDND